MSISDERSKTVGVEVLLITAPGDGIQPAAILQSAGPARHQYLINAPEGFSRLCMEHKVRPGPRLRAIFCTQQPQSDLAGLPALILRLKEDGHKEVSVVGPPGTLAFVSGLKHVIGWTHPAVTVSELNATSLNQEAYTDGTVEVISLQGSPKVWVPPAWLLTGSSTELHAEGNTCTGNGGQPDLIASEEGGQSSDEDTSACTADKGTQSSSSECSSRKAEDSSSSEDSLTSEADADGKSDRFASIDKALMSAGGKSSALAVLAQQSRSRGTAFKPPASSKVMGFTSRPAGPGHATQSCSNAQGSLCSATHPKASNSVREMSAQWGFLMHFKDIDKFLLSVNFDSLKSFRAASQHPVMAYLDNERLSTVLHFSPPAVQASKAYSDWAARLSGKQVMRTSNDRSLGHVSSARLSIQLHHIAPHNFALPHSLAKQDRSLPGPGAESANVCSWHLLRKLQILREGSVNVDDSQITEQPDQEEVVAELLQKRPELEAKLAAVVGRTSNKCATWKHTRLPPLPAFPRKRGPAEEQHHDNLKRQKLVHPVSFPGGWGMTQQPSLGHYPCSNSQNFLQNSHQQLRSQQPVFGRPDSCTFPLWGRANVTDQGRLLGTVQLTPHGWVGPPEAVRKMNGQPGINQTCFIPDACAQAPAGPIRHHPWPQHPPPRAHPLPQGAPLAGPLAAPPFNTHVSNGGAPTNAGHSLQAETTEKQGVQWNQDDIAIASESDTDSEVSESSGRSPPCKTLTTAGSPAMPSASQNPRTPAFSADKNIAADINPLFQNLAARGDSTGLVVLGTGCAEPSKYRACSGTLLQLNNGRNILLDAGEGTVGQMVRYFGSAASQIQIDNLAAIFVSHRHADHSTGLPGVLRARCQGTAPLLVLCPKSCASWLRESYPDLHSKHRVLHFSELVPAPAEIAAWLRDCLGLEELLPFNVTHCSDAWGLKIMHVDGWSICYSGDTRPCKSLVQAARGCTLLIHEATYSSDLVNMVSMALQKKHSTVEEAVSVASQAQVEFCLLTHFSQRYGKLPCLPRGTNFVAFDGLRLTLTQLPHLQDVFAALTDAFSECDGTQAENPEVQQDTCSAREDPSVVNESDTRQSKHNSVPRHIRFED